MKHTFSDTVKRFTDEVPTTDIRLTHLNRWLEELGQLDVSDIDQNDIKDVLERWRRVKTAKGKPWYSLSTLNRHRNSASVVFEKAISWGWTKRNPCKDVKPYKEPLGRVRILTDEERKRLLDACQENPCSFLYLIVVLALSTGMRKSELLSLKWDDIDFQKKTINARGTKRSPSRKMPVFGASLVELRRYVKSFGHKTDSEYLFPGSRRGKITFDPSERPFSIRKAWEEALRVAKIRNFRFHDLRHSCAAYLAMSGASIDAIKAILGHKTIDAVERYIHLTLSDTKTHIARLNRKMFGSK